MRLSTAIALGRVTIEVPLRVTLNGCALGMAANAVGIPRLYAAIENAWPWLKTLHEGCPVGRCNTAYLARSSPLTLKIAHIFDWHVMRESDWTLDQLIDWVRSVEPAEEIPQQVMEESHEQNLQSNPSQVA